MKGMPEVFQMVQCGVRLLTWDKQITETAQSEATREKNGFGNEDVELVESRMSYTSQ